MQKLAVYKHADGSFSAPFCEVGKEIVLLWYNPRYIGNSDSTSCGAIGCTCSNNNEITIKATPDEKNKFYETLRSMASEPISPNFTFGEVFISKNPHFSRENA